MTLQLNVMRHAKSSWKQPVADFDRGLNKRGRAAALLMGSTLAGTLSVDSVVCSPALRARLTLATATEGYPALAALPQTAPAWLYTFDLAELLDGLATLPVNSRNPLVIGHNPALTRLINFCVGAAVLDNLPTAGFARLQLEVDRWADIEQGCGRLAQLLLPRRLKDAVSVEQR